MHVEVDASLLAKDLKNVAYIVGHFKEESKFACIYLQAANDHLTVILSNDRDKAIINIPCTVREDGECYVTAHKFIGLIQSFTDKIELIKGDTLLNIKQNKSCFNLSLFKDGVVDTAPVQMSVAHSLTIDGSKFNNMISVVSPFVDPISQGVIAGVNIQAKNNRIEMRSCHNAAMAMSKQKCEMNNDCNLNVTLKTETLQAIGKLFADETVVIEATDKLVRFIGETCTIYARVMFGDFPPIDKLIQDKSVCSLQIQRAVLERCLRRVLIVKTLSKQLHLHVGGNTLTITYENSLTESFEVEQSNNDVDITINYEYMLNVLRVLGDATLTLEIMPPSKLIFTNKNNLVMVCALC